MSSFFFTCLRLFAGAVSARYSGKRYSNSEKARLAGNGVCSPIL